MARGRRRSAVSMTVPQLLNEVQRGVASAHVRYSKMLWELATSDALATCEQLLTAMKHFATVAEPTLSQTRLLNFFGTFANDAEGRDAATTEDRLNFIAVLLEPLIELTGAKDHCARWRFCQLVHALVGNLPQNVEPSDALDKALGELEEAMLERLDDSQPRVRSVAVRALARLFVPGEAEDYSDCELTARMIEMLESENSTAVRKAVLATLPYSSFTHPYFVERTRDVSDDVRKMVYMAIKQRVPLPGLSTDDAVLLVRRGLGDRAPAVRAEVSKLVMQWLEDSCDGEPLRLVHQLDVQRHPEECELVLRMLLKEGQVNAVHLGRLAESDSIGLRADFSRPGAVMGPASALFWRVVCEWLKDEATERGLSAARRVGQAAEIENSKAAEANQALDAALPPTVADMADIIAQHAAAGAAARFACAQLMQLAARCMDFGDAAGRSDASLMLRRLLTDVPTGDNAEEAAAWEAAWRSPSWLRALALFLRKVYGSPKELADGMLPICGDLYTSGGFATEGFEVAEQAWVHALGVAGLLLEQLTSARQVAAAGEGHFSLRDLLDRLVQPGLRHRSAKVRREAVRCLGLYCSLDGIPTSLSSHLVVLRQVLITHGESATVRAVAAQALGDVALARGPKEVDRCLMAELAGGLLPGLDPELQQKAVVDLLLDVLRQWAEEFAGAAAAGAKKRAGVRRGSRGSADDLEALGGLGAALVEGLARLARTHLRWQAREEAEAVAAVQRGEQPRELAMEDIDAVKVLVELTLLHFNPEVEAASLATQVLPVFFQNYAELTSEHQQFLATAFLPAARLAAGEDKVSGKRITAATCTSSKVMGFLAQLLQTPYGDKQEPVGHEVLVDLLLRELYVCSAMGYEVPKPYLLALCRTVAALDVFPVGEPEDTDITARRLLELARQLLTEVPDSSMRKDLKVLLDKLHARARAHRLSTQPLTPEEIAVLIEQLQNFKEAEDVLADYPLPFDAIEQPEAPAAGGRKGAAAKTPGRGRRAAAADDSSEEEEDDGPQMPQDSDDEEDGGEERTPARVPPTASRRMPDRAARSARKPLVEAATSSSDEEEEDSEGEAAQDSEEEEGEEEDALSPLAENLSPAVRRPSKARRQSSDSVSALRQALQENRIS
ncbi:ARM repeat superfamily isoform 1 [Chlorella sorokiniana]|uniref:ARM repeat superfamily isoform 1 n=1 Tax=Chlorella sorokiniana TaxID=3076 RepID=A0A2P6U031_CHLSO|nr:ARM repeat superfamily isoform 1 [Chlorella sorokiniana]|eukprot:PRW59671.1 ARM repeat superfamily isoform 1 [Chlorella sorokiniana]